MSPRIGQAVKIDAGVAHDAKIVAAFRGLTLTDYLTETLRPIVERDLRQAVNERSNEHQKLSKSDVAPKAE
jgi:hypothetical protein